MKSTFEPIKRSEYLVELSREHHQVLLFCWKLKRGIEMKIDAHRLLSFVNFFWTEYLQPHVYQEESILFPNLSHELVENARKQHTVIRGLMTKAIEDGENGTRHLLEMAEQLNSHVRFEERVLFPLMEREVPATVLASVGRALSPLAKTANIDAYTDEFWKSRAS